MRTASERASIKSENGQIEVFKCIRMFVFIFMYVINVWVRVCMSVNNQQRDISH